MAADDHAPRGDTLPPPLGLLHRAMYSVPSGNGYFLSTYYVPGTSWGLGAQTGGTETCLAFVGRPAARPKHSVATGDAERHSQGW